MYDREEREREILEKHLRGTPVEGDEDQMRRLMELGMLDRIRAVAIIAGGEADTVDGALGDYREREEFHGDVMRDIKDL